MLSPSYVRNQLSGYFLKPANKQKARLDKYAPSIAAYKLVNGQRMVVTDDGTWMPETTFHTLPKVFYRQLIQDFWRQFELTNIVIQHPFSYMGLRSLYEQAFRKIIIYSIADEQKQQTIATKVWLCTWAMTMKRVSDGQIHDQNDLKKYNELLSLLSGQEKASYEKIRDDGFLSKVVHKKMSEAYGTKGIEEVMENNQDLLFHPIIDVTPIDAVLANYRMMHGYAHLNTAHTSYAGLILGEQKGEHLRRIRTSMCMVGYQMLELVNNSGFVPVTDISRTRTFIRRIGRQIERENQNRT